MYAHVHGQLQVDRVVQQLFWSFPAVRAALSPPKRVTDDGVRPPTEWMLHSSQQSAKRISISRMMIPYIKYRKRQFLSSYTHSVGLTAYETGTSNEAVAYLVSIKPAK